MNNKKLIKFISSDEHDSINFNKNSMNNQNIKHNGCLMVLLMFITMVGISILFLYYNFKNQGPHEPYDSWVNLEALMTELGDDYIYPSYIPNYVYRDQGVFQSLINRNVAVNDPTRKEGYYIQLYRNKNNNNDIYTKALTDIVVWAKKIYFINNEEHDNSVNEEDKFKNKSIIIINELPVNLSYSFTTFKYSSNGDIDCRFCISVLYYYKDITYCMQILSSYRTPMSEDEVREKFLEHKECAVAFWEEELIKMIESMKPASEILNKNE